jgi:hypothetical protein
MTLTLYLKIAYSVAKALFLSISRGVSSFFSYTSSTPYPPYLATFLSSFLTGGAGAPFPPFLAPAAFGS